MDYAKDISQLRVTEAWPFYDTVVIDPDLPEKVQDDGFQSYADLGASGLVSFFGQKRKRATVKEAYSNLEIDGMLSFGMYVYSLGISFKGPITTIPGEVGPAQDAAESMIFNAELPKHMGVVLRINQDEKLVSTLDLTPEGTGYSGTTEFNAFSGLGSAASVQGGAPVLTNRWHFPEPLKLLRGTIINLELQFSSYARQLLSGMRGPGYYDFVDSNGDPLEKPVPRRAIIRASFIAKREAMIRDAYQR